jgi:5-methylcytosine-specific restriction enzyme A
MTLPRPCIDCGRLTRNATRCTDCARAASRYTWRRRGKTERYRNGDWEQRSRAMRAEHLQAHGPLCPGWARPPHWVRPDALVVDHDLGVLCRSCNAVKAATVDKRRARVPVSESAPRQHPGPARKPVTHPLEPGLT